MARKNFVFGQRLRERRLERGLSQKALGQSVGIGRTSIVEYEGGQVPSTEIINKLADLLETSMDYLCGRTDNPALPATIVEQEDQPAHADDAGRRHVLQAPAAQKDETMNSAGITWQAIAAELLAHIKAQDEIAKMRAAAEQQREANDAQKLENERYVLESERPKIEAEAIALRSLASLADDLRRGDLSHLGRSVDAQEQVSGD